MNEDEDIVPVDITLEQFRVNEQAFRSWYAWFGHWATVLVLLSFAGYGLAFWVWYRGANMSAILLEKNGKLSSGNRTKHIHIRFFFIKDQIVNHKLTVNHRSTTEMTGDFYTKPLQGRAFKKIRNQILNLTHD